MDILKSLKRMLAKAEREKTGIPVTANSIQDAITFIENLPHNIAPPDIEIHPDCEVALTWRGYGTGIINIAFDGNGTATWAACLIAEKDKGRFQVKARILDNVKNLIQRITGVGEESS